MNPIYTTAIEATLSRPGSLRGGVRVALPYADGGISAGFPSPAQDYITAAIDLNTELIRHREATFYARVKGDSMRGAGIFDGDLIVIDKSLEAADKDYVVACIDGEFTLKQFRADSRHGRGWLVPANRQFRPIRITPETRIAIWGVVTHVVRSLRQRG